MSVVFVTFGWPGAGKQTLCLSLCINRCWLQVFFCVFYYVWGRRVELGWVICLRFEIIWARNILANLLKKVRTPKCGRFMCPFKKGTLFVATTHVTLWWWWTVEQYTDPLQAPFARWSDGFFFTDQVWTVHRRNQQVLLWRRLMLMATHKCRCDVDGAPSALDETSLKTEELRVFGIYLAKQTIYQFCRWCWWTFVWVYNEGAMHLFG